MSDTSHRNSLGTETSPYLLQHADNPVHWYPWGPEALERAAREDKPILLSIGYSACHWCHVMAHESFEDEATATLMNEHYVNIKVDREERPDIDKIYQLAHQLLTRRAGGWPLTVFLTPDDQRPFFAGTYFPREPRFGMPAFKELLMRVNEFYQTNREDIRRQNESLIQALASTESVADPHAIITPSPLGAARAELGRAFDSVHGGFGGAPKFPHPTNLERALRHYAATTAAGEPDVEALGMATFSLAKMALGGVYDQVGGGFSRYSVDDLWMIPHFEKMLYDNGPLLTLCAESWQLTGDPLFRRAGMETAEWVMREMQSPEGGFYSALDADSEGEEGKFYVWTPDEVRDLLTEAQYRVMAPHFGLDRRPNFEGKHWHLHVFRDLSSVAAEAGISPEAARSLVDEARHRLFETRVERVPPGLDDKVLTSWNALMIKGMATAGRIFGEPALGESADRAMRFIRDTMWSDGRLLATYKDGKAHLAAYVDDYAFTIDALLTLLGCRWQRADLEFAVALADVLLQHFEDAEQGGFYFTAHDHERLIQRPKPFMDDALPAGNGIAAMVLGRLGHLLADTRYLEASERTLRAAWPSISQFPHAHNAMLLAVEEYLYPPQTIVLRGEAADMESWRSRALDRYAPRRMVVAIPSDEPGLPGILAERTPKNGVTAYVCEGHRCEAPMTSSDEFEAALGPAEVGQREVKSTDRSTP